MNQHLFPAPQIPTDSPLSERRAIDRAQHVVTALGLRRTAHHQLAQAAIYPRHADYCRSEFKRIMALARFEITRARNQDAWAEWKARTAA